MCKASKSKFKITVTSWSEISGASVSEIESSMASYVQSTGPLSIAVDANDWSDYTGLREYRTIMMIFILI